MQMRFNQNLGLLDIRRVKEATGVQLDPAQCKEGQFADLPQKAIEALAEKYPGLLSPVAVKGEAKQPELTAPKK